METFTPTKYQTELMQHTLGYDYCHDKDGNFEPFRNDFVTGLNCKDFKEFVALEKNGFVQRFQTSILSDNICFSCTEKGKEFCKNVYLDEIEKQKQQRSKMTKSKRRYELYKYLDLADCDISFAYFLLSHKWDEQKAKWNCL